MPLISQVVDNLLGGVSQKPTPSRSPSECTEQVNGMALWGKGLIKRPPSKYVGKLTSTTTRMAEAFVHPINRDGVERYHVIISNGDLKVYDAVTGTAKTVTYPNGKTYLSSSLGFRAVTIGDVTFITNRSTIPATDAVSKVAARVPEAIVFIRQADFSTTYYVKVNSTTISYTTRDGTVPTDRPYITTDYIAQQLYNLLVSSGPAGFSYTLIGSSIYITRSIGYTTVDFTVAASDGLADQAIYAVKGTIQRFEDLPGKAKQGMYLEVTGDPGSQYDNYYVTYDNNSADGQVGVWRETVKVDEIYKFDYTTLPHSLTRNADGTFTFDQVTWRNREVGSAVTNPYASFIGKPIKDVFFHKGRLGFLAGENVILSQAASVTNFWRQSAKELYDNDLIDITAAFPRVTNFHTFLEWNNVGLLWANNAQVTLDAGDVLSPKTVGLTLITALENQSAIRPIVVGGRLFFAQILNLVTRVSEYYIDNQTGKPCARDITADQPTYLQGSPVAMVGIDTPGMLAILMDGKRNSIFTYDFKYDGDQQIQGAWGHWDFANGRVAGLDYVAGSLGVILIRNDGVHLERIDLSAITQGTPSSRVVTSYIGRGASSGTIPFSSINWAFDNWESTAGNAIGGDFEYTAGAGHTAASKTQNVYFDSDITYAAVTLNGADYADTAVNFWDAGGNLLGTLTTWTVGAGSEMRSFVSAGIRRIEFVPHSADLDYVTWQLQVQTTSNLPVYLDHQRTYLPVHSTFFSDTFTDVDGTLLSAHAPDTAPTATYSTNGSVVKVLGNKAVLNGTAPAGRTKIMTSSPAGSASTIGEEIWADITMPANFGGDDHIGFVIEDNGAGTYVLIYLDGQGNNTTSLRIGLDQYVANVQTHSNSNTPPRTLSTAGLRLGVTILSATSWQVWMEDLGGGNRQNSILVTGGSTIPLSDTGWGLYFRNNSGGSTMSGFAWDNIRASYPSVLNANVNASAGLMTLPFAIATDGSEGEVVVFRMDTGVEVPCTRPSTTTVQVSTDVLGATVVVGLRYTFTYTPSDLYIRRATKAGAMTEAGGRLTVRYLTFLLQDTADLTVSVAPDGRSPYSYSYHQTTTLPTDRFKVPVAAKNDTVDIVVSNSSCNGSTLAGLDWEAHFHIRSQRT